MKQFRKVIHPDRTISYEPIELIDKPISSGGEGGVFLLAGKDWWIVRYGTKDVRKRACAKLYNQTFLIKHEKELEKKLTYMIDRNNRPEHLDDGVVGLAQICYPFAILYDAPNGRFVGFLMHFALEDSIPLTILTADRSPQLYKKQRELGLLNQKHWELFQKFCFPDATHTATKRYAFLLNIASVVNYIHATGKYVIADLKPDNFLITIHGGVSIVDINSIQVSDGKKNFFPSLVATPDYIPPELQTNPAGKKTVSYDLFSMAVVFYQVLTGTHPFNYSVKDGGPNLGTSIQEHIRGGHFACGKSRKHFVLVSQHMRYDNLPESLKRLFQRAFEGSPNNRPTAREWMEAIKVVWTGRPVSPASAPQKTPEAAPQNTAKPKPTPKKPARTNAPPVTATMPQRIPYAWKMCCPMCGHTYLDPVTSRYCHNCGTARK